MVTYVALLLLLQLGTAPAEAISLSAMLFLPWVTKPLLRYGVRGTGHFRGQLHVAEALLSASLLLMALAVKQGSAAVFLCLCGTSLLCVWHELVAGMCYEKMLLPVYQRLFSCPKMVCTQLAIIFTYGALIFLVGTLQVYFRQIRYSWSVGCYVVAGVFLLFAFHHLLWLRSPYARVSHGTWEETDKEDVRLVERIRRQKALWRPMLILLLLLFPQGLLFHTRVLYLFTARAMGGLGCTMQEIGFAQGTIGVIAFSAGMAVGRHFIARCGFSKTFWPMAVSLALSPVIYLGMTVSPPSSLFALSACTMAAQLFFGFGIGICRLPVSAVSGARYSCTVSMLQVPLVSAAMFLPMAASGWLAQRLGFSLFFLVNALSAPVCLLSVFLLRRQRKGF